MCVRVCACVCVCVCVRGFRYIPLPKASARRHLIKHLLKDNPAEMSDADVDTVVKVTKGEAVPACRKKLECDAAARSCGLQRDGSDG